MLERVAVLYNPLSDASIQLSREVVDWLTARGINATRGVSQEFRDQPQLVADCDLMIALGGDGTVLRAARLCFPHNIPVLPVALGHLSFMAEIGPDEIYSGCEQIMNGGGWFDERALVRAQHWRNGQKLGQHTALNEVVISRSDLSRIVNVHVTIDDSPLTTYHADGVIVATATGSTAYALAAGGPIVDPRSQALVLVPIAAHLTNIPSMVLHEDAVVTMQLRSRHHALLAVDGRENIDLIEGDEVVVRRSPQVCTFVRLRPSNQFYTQLVARLRRS
ncbi:NAD(+)/NADH kinase [Chloroflexus sp.]|uniref:NAD(+)/NADH kinase n=1 Tax=Chloroflexus sp. TaxID=1904827 RepID=UPI0029FDE9A1|nr:NAD(+)/NADH kinase [Chloroflexus sp.]MCS6887473.1 NAD(+)/NADH kinase [Chloroflexus sp.]